MKITQINEFQCMVEPEEGFCYITDGYTITDGIICDNSPEAIAKWHDTNDEPEVVDEGDNEISPEEMAIALDEIL